MSQIDEKQKSFKENGFHIEKNIISEDDIRLIFENIFEVYDEKNPSTKFANDENRMNNSLFNSEIIKFREENKDVFSEVYDSSQSSVPLVNLVTSKKISDVSALLLNCKPSQLSQTGYMVRMGTPKDTRNKTAWHQEIAFVRNPGLVLWIPLVEISKDIGPLHILEKSHLEGEIIIERNNIREYTKSRVSQTEIPVNILEKYNDVTIEINKGDALFFDHKLIHKSGDNISDRIRFSCQARYMNSTSKDYASFRTSATYNPYSMKRLQRRIYE